MNADAIGQTATAIKVAAPRKLRGTDTLTPLIAFRIEPAPKMSVGAKRGSEIIDNSMLLFRKAIVRLAARRLIITAPKLPIASTYTVTGIAPAGRCNVEPSNGDSIADTKPVRLQNTMAFASAYQKSDACPTTN